MAQTVTVRLPADELYTLQPTAGGDTVTWWCRLCTSVGNAHTASRARSPRVTSMTVEAQRVIDETDQVPGQVRPSRADLVALAEKIPERAT